MGTDCRATRRGMHTRARMSEELRSPRTWPTEIPFLSIPHLAMLPLQIIIYFEARRIFLGQTVLVGLINRSGLVRQKVQSALQMKLTKVEFRFTEAFIDHPSWLLILAGGRPLKPWLKTINLAKFVAFSHCFLFKEEFVNHIIDYSLCSANYTKLRATFYCFGLIKWVRLGYNFWTISLGLKAVPLPVGVTTDFNMFIRFVISRPRDVCPSHSDPLRVMNLFLEIAKLQSCRDQQCPVCAHKPSLVLFQYLLEMFYRSMEPDHGQTQRHQCPEPLCTSDCLPQITNCFVPAFQNYVDNRNQDG